MRLPAAGLTLIELLIAIAIAAIMLTIGVPSFQRQQIEKQVLAQREAMLNSLASARVAAQRFAVPAIVCPSADGATCSNDWSQGWLIYLDNDNSNSLSTGEQILNIHQYGGTVAINGSVSQVVFRPNGMTTTATINLCAGSFSDLHRAISMNPTGAIESLGSSNANCPTP